MRTRSKRMYRASPPLNSAGFSLLEVLIVIAIMGMLSGIAIVSLAGRSTSSSLDAASSQAESFFSEARQNSISKGVLTAVIVLTPPSDPNAYRTLTAMQLALNADGTAASGWIQVSKWEHLPSGVVIDNTANNTVPNSSFLQNSQGTSIALPTVQYQENTYAPITGYSYQIYGPSGCLISPPSPCYIKLVSGHYSGSSLIYAGQSVANYVSFTFINATGETKTTRP